MDDYVISTPEQLNLTYKMAGLGSRFLAFAVDTAIQLFLSVVIVISLSQLSTWNHNTESYLALIIVLYALVFHGYYMIFEILMKGRTPGKALVKIRVVLKDGRAADLSGLVLRNLIRLVDSLPFFYIVGILCMFINKDSRRLGDIAAGTIVIIDKKRATLDSILSRNTAEHNSRLTDHETAIIRDFLARKAQLSGKARFALAEQIALPLYERYGIPESQRENPESFLEDIYLGR
ncbi:MAG: RDD family protein [Eubacteriaceae bacterium]|nr:RDD family protein [Eubacteriaceae bacterium]